MNTPLQTMTTEQLIDACADEGVVVSVTQLGRWVREGLIPASLRRRHGRGRGMGAEWLWEAECLPRVLLIARALAVGAPSFQRAARFLAEAGYAPAPSRLRMTLLDCLAAYKQLMTKRQTYLTGDHPQAEKRKRLTKHMRRKMAEMPDSAFQPFTMYIGALLGVIPANDPSVPDVLKWLQQFFSIHALQNRIETIDSPVLLEKYEEARHVTPFLMPLVLDFINLFLFPLYKQQLQNAGHETLTLPTTINPEEILENVQLIGSVRFALTIFLIALPAENTLFLNLLGRMLWDLLPSVFGYIGIPHESVVRFMESMDASSAHPAPSA